MAFDLYTSLAGNSFSGHSHTSDRHQGLGSGALSFPEDVLQWSKSKTELVVDLWPLLPSCEILRDRMKPDTVQCTAQSILFLRVIPNYTHTHK